MYMNALIQAPYEQFLGSRFPSLVQISEVLSLDTLCPIIQWSKRETIQLRCDNSISSVHCNVGSYTLIYI